jgi:Leucine-rich repeat (LRR) protein
MNTVPYRQLKQACNPFAQAPLECAADGKYPALDLMDLAFNYIEKEKNILPLAQLPQLTRLILYGNPLAGE